MTSSSPPGPRDRRGRILPYLAVGAALLAIGLATLWPVRESEVALDHICVLCGSLGLQDFLDNVLLFVPLGLALGLAGLGRARSVVLAAIVTATVELLQYRIVTGRDASVGDIISNTLGGAVGVALAAGWRHLLVPTPRVARALALAGAAGWLAVLAVTAWALGPLVRPGVYEMEWKPNDPSLSEYHGEPLAVRIAGRPAPPGPVGDMRPMLEGLRRRDLELATLATTGNARADFAPIARVMQLDLGRDPSELVGIGERGCDAEFHVRLRVAALRLRSPVVSAPRVFPCGGDVERSRGEAEGDTVAVAGGMSGSTLWVRVVRGGRTTSRAMELTPTLGWSFFLPWAYGFGGTDWPLSALWVGGLLLAVGYWAGRGGAAWALPVLGGTIALGLAALPLASGLAVPAPGEWAAALLGAGVGWWAGRQSSRSAAARGDRAPAA